MTQRQRTITLLSHQIFNAVLAGRRDPANVLMEIVSEWTHTGRPEAAYINGLTSRSYAALKNAVRDEVTDRLMVAAAAQRHAAR